MKRYAWLPSAAFQDMLGVVVVLFFVLVENYTTYLDYWCCFFLQAVNDIVLGGDLVTTVCHSSPFIVDITPPIMHSVSDVIFDDGFRFLAVYYNATDNLSGIGRLEFGLGKTKYDVMIRKYMPFEIQGNEDNTHLLNKEFETASAVPAWIRLKVVDNGWCTSRSSSSFQVLC